MSSSSRVARSAHAHTPNTASAPEQDRAGAHHVQLKRTLVGMDFAAQEAALSPERGVQMKEAGTGYTPVGPSVEQIVQDAYTLGGQSRYQVTPQEAMRWVEDHMRNARPEHKYAFIEAMKRINKRL